jgi:cysteine desulfurase
MFWQKKNKAKRTYLDYAAGPAGNPSSVHEEGRVQKKMLENARKEVARLVEVKADDVIFTGGATEANAIAILGLPKKGDHVLYLPSAHASIVENAKLLAGKGVDIEPLPIANGRVDIEALKSMIRPETVLVTMEAVCGETGTIWNTREVKNRIGKVYLHVDASQAPFTEKISRAHFSADLLTYDGAKLGVPGTGVLIAHRTIPLAPIYGGGGQERGLRSGTQNVAAIVEFAKALDDANKNHEAFKARAVELRAGLIADLTRLNLRNNASRFNLDINEGHETVANILNISLPGRDTDYLVALLDEAGFALSTKSACESLSSEGSRAVLALTGDSARAASTLRISFGPATTARELARFATALAGAIHFIDTTALR